MTSDYLKIFEKNQYEIQANDVASSFVYSLENRGETKLQKNQFVTFKNDVSLTGFINLKIEAKENSLIYILFDEINTNNDEHLPANICFYRNTTHNIVTYELEKGVYELCSFEPYTAKYIRVVCLDGCIDIKKLGIIKYENPDKKISYGFKDKKITKIFDAAINTFVQNSVDILTDCPSRERAGWLFDSFFSAEAEQYITGKNVVEKSFLACYLNYKKTSYIPKGMIPMCYPADFNMKESFIPNWSMWYVLELDRYYKRTGDKKLIDDSFKNIKGLLKYFSKFENEYGLLENLNGWIFVEWSACNDLNHVCGVNFPSNMLYSLFLITCGKLLNDANLINKGKNLRKVINELSFDGQFYVDNSTRVNGVLTKTNNLTETCQYYAFYTGIAIIEEKPELFKVLMNCFGPSRDFTNTYPNVSKSNTLPGDYLRLILLNRFGHRNLAAKEAIKYFYNMALITGTLWEREDTSCSLNHCFTSYIINIILNSYFGLLEINKKDHKVLINKKSLKISANVSIPVDDNYLILVKNNGDLQVILPKGYELEWI